MKKITLTSIFALGACGLVNAQNVGINTDGSAPGMMLHVKVASGNDGIRIQNNSGTADGIINFQDGTANAWTLGFDASDNNDFKVSNGAALGTNDRFVIDDNADQILSGFNGTQANPAWSFNGDPNTGMFRSAADELAFTAAGVELMVLDANGADQVVVNENSTDVNFRVESNGDANMLFVDGGNNRVGISTGAPVSMFHVDGNSAINLSHIDNSNGTGTGLVSTGQNGILNYLLAGCGSSATAVTTSQYMYYTTGGVGQAAVMQDAFGAQWLAGAWDGFQYLKITGNGGVATIIDDPNGEKVTMFCVEGPENWFQDYGTGSLVNGEAVVEFDPIFANSIMADETHPIKVFVQLEGECNGVYVTEKTTNGFRVKELNSGSSTVDFTYTVVATRANETLEMNGNVRHVDYSRRYPKSVGYQESLVTGQNTRE